MAAIPNVHLSLPSSPENVLVVRQALSGVATSLALDAIETNDVNTAVTEACNNVVMHAYGDGEGALEVEVFALAGALAVVVRDRGRGMRQLERGGAHVGGDDGGGGGEHEDGGAGEDQHVGMGIPVMETLSRRVEFLARAGGGTEVRMEFDAPRRSPLAPLEGAPAMDAAIDSAGPAAAPVPAPGEPRSAIELRLTPNAVARAVLPRVLSALAARAHFPTDRISEVQLLAATLATDAGERTRSGRLDVAVTVAPRSMRLRVAPPGAGDTTTLELSVVDERPESG
jgi:serine/threonine-protein kinase RsbW